MVIYIPDKVMRGRPVDAPVTPEHGRVLLKHPSGVIAPYEPTPSGEWFTPFSHDNVLATVPAGFTQVVLHSSGRMCYLADWGNDANTGLSPSQPKATPAAVMSLTRQGQGDIVCIERGSSTTWDLGDFTITNPLRGGVEGKPTVITWFGTGTRPRVIAPSMNRNYHSHIWWIGLNFVNPYAEFGNPLYNGSTTKRNFGVNGAGITNWRVEDCEFTGVERTYQSRDGSYVGNIVDRRNISHYVYSGSTSTTNSSRPSAIYSYACDNLTIEQNVEDFSGWHPDVVAGTYNGATITGAGANTYNHAYYIGEGNPHSGVNIFDNIMSRPSSHMAQLRSGGRAERNTGFYAAVGFALGYYDPPIPDGRLCRLQDNLILRLHSMYRNAGSCQGVCTPAMFGLDYSAFNPNATYESIGNVIAETSTDLMSHASPPSPIRYSKTWYHPELGGNRGFPNETNLVTSSGDRIWRIDSPTQGDGQFTDPGRSLEGYLSGLSGEEMTYDQSMNVLKSRGAYEWSLEVNPMAIHSYIMAGYAPA